jgi:hypothetical protein
MNQKIIHRIHKKAGIPDLSKILIDKLRLTELKSLLMYVFSEKTAKLSYSDVYREYKSNRFVRPSTVDLIQFMNLDKKIFSLLPSDFEAIALSSLAPLGSCSVLAGVPQNIIVTTSRNTEVTADATNVMALECAVRREKILLKNSKSNQRIKLCTSHRHTRTQSVEDTNFTPHFTIIALCTGGRDEGNLLFEKETISEHIAFYLNIFQHIADLRYIRHINIILHDYKVPGNDEIIESIQNQIKGYEKVKGIVKPDSDFGKNYYSQLRFTIEVTNDKNEVHMYADGGFTDWTAKILENKKERLMTSGIGTEYLLKTLKLK